MAGTFKNDDGGIVSEINVTPLVDVMMVLLVIFIVTASAILRTNIPLELPRAQTAEETGAGLLTLTVAKDGALYINGRPGTLDEIAAAVGDLKERQTDTAKPLAAMVSADVGAAYGMFAEVVDRLRLAGVTEIAMDTRPVALDEARTPPADAPPVRP